MKKSFYLFLILTATFFVGCSNNSSTPSTNDHFLKINLNGTELSYNNSLFSSGFMNQSNCANNGKLYLIMLGQVENSNFFVECNLAHFENLIDFSDATKNKVAVTRVTDTNSIWDLSTHGLNSNFCNLNNDLSLVIEDKSASTNTNRVYLKLKPNSTFTHTITKTQFVSESSTSKKYTVEGNFTATFIKGNADFPVSGSYRTQIKALK
jgi:hypothetical protein